MDPRYLKADVDGLSGFEATLLCTPRYRDIFKIRGDELQEGK